ncbi:saccharopine dehydrogenase family protein [Sessilibacter corallicola]|uniref:Saccharopine dehydrogenase family protein n=1 Tax=Sessilibacter corallicola TaxID=2904075 RepID=A0ABQ0AAN6_9GAMM
MKNILLLGAGKIGCIITEMLSSTGDYFVTVVDKSELSLSRMPKNKHVECVQVDVTCKEKMLQVMDGKFAVLCACPFNITKYAAEVAAEVGVHYLDLTEDVETTRFVKSLSENSKAALIPQCGLAPGFISIVAHGLTKGFDKLRNVHMRVGALPKYPSNALKYNLTWSTDGLINEYCNPCEAIYQGELVSVPPMEEIEEFSLDGIDYEAFNTSGGLGTLCESLSGRVDNLNYRTVRYPGHRDVMKLLLQDLRLVDRRDLLKEILESALPITYQDVVLVFVNVDGYINNQLIQKTFAHKIYSQEINGVLYSAIQITTSAGICGVLDLLATGELPQSGFVKQEDISYNAFIKNRFGRYYASPEGENNLFDAE